MFKPTVSFKLVSHKLRPNQQVVEIWVDEHAIATIYADQEKAGIRVVSAHMVAQEVDPKFDGEVKLNEGVKSVPPMPQVSIRFRRAPWYLGLRGIVRSVSN